MRASDEQRQRVIDELRRHCVAGRLDIDEYAARIEQALAATSVEDLIRVLGELPMLGIADLAGAGRVDGSHRETASTSDALAGGGWRARLAASAVVVVSVIVVLVAVALALALSWVWAAVLVVGWLLGLAQARLGGRRG